MVIFTGPGGKFHKIVDKTFHAGGNFHDNTAVPLIEVLYHLYLCMEEIFVNKAIFW